MAFDRKIQVKVTKNDEVLKIFEEPLENSIVNSKISWTYLLQTWENIGKDVNIFLTTLMKDRDKLYEEEPNLAEELEEDSDEELEELSFKRKCSVDSRKKVKKAKVE